VAQGCNALDAAALGSFTLGSTALLAGYKRSERGIIARDVIDALPRFLYDLENAD
jgi:NAD(P)H-hydrate repair Nnr-like enzyme with NAD(P)H-hydrate dehydratase domain